MSIVVLDQAVANTIGSTSAISDPCSVVKELVDNALDAKATSVSIELPPNTLDTIQVKDNGLGIPAEDCPLICKRNYTSKIRTLEDLKNVGGTSLGFRGEALANTAEMSESVAITTRTAKEITATLVKFGRTSEILSRATTSHPIGTSVRVTNFLKYLPVRRQTILKSSSKVLSRIKRLLQEYALSRPHVRFSLKVLSRPQDSWIYAPKRDPSVLDAIIKVLGAELAAQCLSHTIDAAKSSSSDGGNELALCHVHAILPKTGADLSKVDNKGQYIFVDNRPLSNSKGMGKTLNKLFKSYIHGDGGYLSKTTIRDPFLYVNITCAPGTYDANIEPLKDDVLFEDIGSIMRLVQRLFETVYDRKDEPGNADRMIHETLQVPNNPSQPAKTEPGNLNCSRDFSKMESVSTAPYQSHALPQTSPEDCRDEFGAKSVDLRSPNAFPQDHINPWTLEQKSCVRACRDPLSQLLTPSRANITVQPRSAFTQNPAKQAKYSCIGDDLGESPTQLRKANESPAEHKSLMQKFDTCSELERVAVNLRTRPSSESSLQEHTDFIAFPSPFEDECIQSGIAARFGNPIGAQKDLPCWSQEIQQKYLSRTSPSLWRTELITRPESSQSHVPFSLTKSLDFEHRKKDAIRLRQELLRREKRRQSTLPDFWNRQSEESNTLLKQESLNQNLRIEAIQSGNRRDISLVPFRAQTTHHNRVTSSACDKNSEFSNKSLIIHSGHRVKVNGTTAKDIPLESIPDELAMHHLATPCLDGIAKIRSLAQRLSEFDSYVGTDAYTPAFTLPLTADLVAQWQTILTELITSVYQCEGKEAEARIRLDLTVTSSYA